MITKTVADGTYVVMDQMELSMKLGFAMILGIIAAGYVVTICFLAYLKEKRKKAYMEQLDNKALRKFLDAKI